MTDEREAREATKALERAAAEKNRVGDKCAWCGCVLTYYWVSEGVLKSSDHQSGSQACTNGMSLAQSVNDWKANTFRRVDSDTAYAPPFGTIRACTGCRALVGGGVTACARCARESRRPSLREVVALASDRLGVALGDVARRLRGEG